MHGTLVTSAGGAPCAPCSQRTSGSQLRFLTKSSFQINFRLDRKVTPGAELLGLCWNAAEVCPWAR